MISGLVTTAASMPVDIAKTRIQNMKYIDGKPEYKGALVSSIFFLVLSFFRPSVTKLGRRCEVSSLSGPPPPPQASPGGSANRGGVSQPGGSSSPGGSVSRDHMTVT